MSLWKRGNVWWVFFYIDGVRHQVSTGTSNRRDAERIEQKLKREANLRRHQVVEVDPKLTFGALAARFIANGARPYHLERLNHLVPYFADIPLVRINKALVQEYMRYRRSQKKITNSTLNRDVSVLRHLLYWAVDQSLLVTNPLGRLRMLRERRTRRPVLSVAEEVRLLEAASDHLIPIIMIALDTGLRRGEILNQTWEDVDLDRRLLWVTRSKTPEGECREIPLTTRLFEYLEANAPGSGPIFTFRDKRILNVKTAWWRAIRKAADRHVRFHDLRHTFNTRLLEAGVIQEVRMALMGHSGGQRVHAIYTHVELPMKRSAIARLEAWRHDQIKTMQKKKEDSDDRSKKVRVRKGFVSDSSFGTHPEALEEKDALRRDSRPGGQAG